MSSLAAFESPRTLVSHARDQIQDLDRRLKIFFGNNPTSEIVEEDPETGQRAYKVRLTSKLPGKLAAIAKDAAGNLRDALDHAVYASATSLGVANPEKTGFPFANDANHLDGELASWKFEDVPAEIKALLKSFQPYPTGNGLLSSLNRLRNPNTHRVIVPIGSAAVGTSITATSGTVTGGSQLGYSKWDPSKNEVEYMRLGPGSTLNHKVGVSFAVTFGDIDAVRGKPVVDTLNQIADLVETIANRIEAECARIVQGRK